MARSTEKNLLVNPSFEDGGDSPAGWEWVVTTGSPRWALDTEIRRSGSRSVRIFQDGRGWWGEFRQSVPCAGGRRYRMRGRIRVAVEGSGMDSGANIYLRALGGGEQVGDHWTRPFFVGR